MLFKRRRLAEAQLAVAIRALQEIASTYRVPDGGRVGRAVEALAEIKMLARLKG